MFDFDKSRILKLKVVKGFPDRDIIEPIFAPREKFVVELEGFRDFLVFTNMRLICVQPIGVTGAKKDYTTLPYHKMQTFSVQTAGYSMETQIQMVFPEMGVLTIEMSGGTNVKAICRLLSTHVLEPSYLARLADQQRIFDPEEDDVDDQEPVRGKSKVSPPGTRREPPKEVVEYVSDRAPREGEKVCPGCGRIYPAYVSYCMQCQKRVRAFRDRSLRF